MEPNELSGGLFRQDNPCPIEGAEWFEARDPGAALQYRFPPGTLEDANWLTTDMLLDGNFMTVFQLTLHEGGDGPVFRLTFTLRNQCSARMRFPLEGLNQNRWQFPREGAYMKPMCGGDPVDPAKVDRMTLSVLRKSEEPSRWCMTPLSAVPEEPPILETPLLPRGPLLDRLGQSTLHDWPQKTQDPTELIRRLEDQLEAAPSQDWPEPFSIKGGWQDLRFDSTGFFRTHHDGERWWLVDPDGFAFWSHGVDCVRSNMQTYIEGMEDALAWMPESGGDFEQALPRDGTDRKGVNFLAANFIRAFGPDGWHDNWAQIALSELRRYGVNTVANWSEWRVAGREVFPYVRPLSPRFSRSRMVFRDMPDVFAPEFLEDAAEFAGQLEETADDPSLVGYFLMNEPTWGFSSLCPAEGMLINTPHCSTRTELAAFLRERYGSDGALSSAWKVPVTFDEIPSGEWRKPMTDEARRDLEAFSTVMASKFFGTLSEACRKTDPAHLNLGIRYAFLPPRWAWEAMKSFDVFSMNCYRERIPDEAEELCEYLGMPLIVGEWHFGALDVGLPASGIGRVPDQRDRGRAYRVYVEDAASKPWCVGVHWFTLYDQSALGRFDGESYNIGFLDTCNRPYEEIAEASRATAEILYDVASGRRQPFDDAPHYLPRLFL